MVIEGSNFGCSSERHLGSPRVIFGREIISHWSLTTCTHERIEFLSPEGQGVQIPVTVERFNQSTIPFFFDYEPPQIDFITSSTWSNNDTPSMGSDLKIEQYILTLVGDNLGNRDTDVMISDEECAILQQNHTMIHCISPIFFGGSHPVQVVVSHQVSNIVDYEFPIPRSDLCGSSRRGVDWRDAVHSRGTHSSGYSHSAHCVDRKREHLQLPHFLVIQF